MSPLTRRRLAAISFYALLLGAFLVLLYGILVARNEAQRGVWFPGEPLPPGNAATTLGSTVELAQYGSEVALEGALDGAAALGIGWLRQELPWDEIEPERGTFQWGPWDRAIEAASGRGFRLVLVLNRTPAWARQPGEEENPLAPPADTTDFVRFATAAAERYGTRVSGWQLWDEPNLMPHWGTERVIEPARYADFLATVAPALRAADPDGIIATAGLAPTGEPGGFNMSEILFLEGLYAAGAAPHFDAVALKPYGFWHGAAERRYEPGQLSFDRPVLAREVMVRHGDAATPVWFVEGGWAALPPGWQGAPPPWGADRAEVQVVRLEGALRRAALEWPWVQLVALQSLQPDAAPDDPRRGLALLDEDGRPTALGETVASAAPLLAGEEVEARVRWEAEGRPGLRRYDRAAWIVAATMLLLGLRLGWHGLRLPWGDWGHRFRARPEWLQASALGATALLFYAIDNRGVALLLYAALGVLIGWRPDLGLAAAAFAIPFFLQAKGIGPLQFSMVELLLWLSLIVWLVRGVLPLVRGEAILPRLRARFWPRGTLDWAVLLFALWAALSVPLAENFGVASREFRVVILDAVIWYWLLRRSDLGPGGRLRLVDALVASATVVALFGLYQWLFTGDIITAEGVRRIRGVYGSPNNLSLFLMRVLPLVGAMVLVAPPSPRRRAYTLAALPLLLCLFLTFSRGAWLLGMPAALLWLGLWGGARARRGVLVLGAAGLLALLPFAATERIASTTDLEGGTWFIRQRLWEATLAMLRDHPLLGVGLDNFLYVYERYRLPEAWREPDLSHPHQIVLHFWVALGLPGLLSLFWQQAAFWRAWWSGQRRTPPHTVARALLVGLGASMLAALSHGLIDNSFFLVDLALVWMLMLALAADLSEELDDNPQHRQP